MALRLFVKIVAPVASGWHSWQERFCALVPKSTKSTQVGHTLQTITENTSAVGLVRFNCDLWCGRLPKIGRAQVYVPAERSGRKTHDIRGFAGFDKVALRGCP
ncbi:MAG: hypothetical protein FWD52_06385 [Candidatus Bathyarchaeota archaeon]|nr:hypothetical protein [Candidatus Termiticorpusculum sp.]